MVMEPTVMEPHPHLNETKQAKHFQKDEEGRWVSCVSRQAQLHWNLSGRLVNVYQQAGENSDAAFADFSGVNTPATADDCKLPM